MDVKAELAALLKAQKGGGEYHCRQVNRVDPYPLARHSGHVEGHNARPARNQLIGGQIEQTPYGWDAARSWIHDVLGSGHLWPADSWTRGWSRQATRAGSCCMGRLLSSPATRISIAQRPGDTRRLELRY